MFWLQQLWFYVVIHQIIYMTSFGSFGYMGFLMFTMTVAGLVCQFVRQQDLVILGDYLHKD